MLGASTFWLGLCSKWRFWLPQALLISGLTLWIYWPSLRGELIWDDEWYVRMNPSLHDLRGLWRFWFQPGSWVEYYPVQETVQWVQWQLWGEHTLGYHLTGLFLHIVNALLVWKLLAKFGLRFAWLGGLIFAVHPVQVDSVAYICELKNTLSLPFFLLSMMAWIDFDEGKSVLDYRKSLEFFLVAMLCKISMAPFWVIILLYAWWKRGRIGWNDFLNCAPFLLVAVVFSYLTIWSGAVYEKSAHAVAAATPLSGILSRLDAAGQIGTVYFARCFLPWNHFLIYPQWPLHEDSLLAWLPWVVMAGVIGFLWHKRADWGRHALLGLGFFFLFLAPFLGFVPVSYMNFTWVMDHFLYLPIIGLIGLVVAGMEGLYARLSAGARLVAVGILPVVVILLTGLSRAFDGFYISEEGFWLKMLQSNPTVWMAHTNLGSRYLELERFPEALVQEKQALVLRPDSGDDYYNLGLVLEKMGRAQEAKTEYERAMKLSPGNTKIYLNLGEMMRRAGDAAKAEDYFREGLKIAPDDASLDTDLAASLVQSGRPREAIAIYEQVAENNPDMAQFQYNLGNALLQMGSLDEAVQHLEAAVSLDPKLVSAHENLGVALAQLGRLPEAMDQFEDVLQLNPNSWQALDNLGMALAQTGHILEAIDRFERALEINPQDAKASDSLAKLKQFEQQQGAAGKN